MAEFREEVPLFCEVDLDQRLARILARLRGMPVPPPVRRRDRHAAQSGEDPGQPLVEVHLAEERHLLAELPRALLGPGCLWTVARVERPELVAMASAVAWTTARSVAVRHRDERVAEVEGDRRAQASSSYAGRRCRAAAAASLARAISTATGLRSTSSQRRPRRAAATPVVPVSRRRGPGRGSLLLLDAATIRSSSRIGFWVR